MEREPDKPKRANTRWRRVVIALLAVAMITACWGGYRSWRTAARLQAFQRILLPLPKDDPVYDDDPKTVIAVQDRPDYLTVQVGSRLVSHWLPDPDWPRGLVLVYLAKDTSDCQELILSVCADVTIDGGKRIISLFARRTDAPSLQNSWIGRVPSTEVGRLDNWLVLQPDDRCSISAADPGLQEGEFVLSYSVNNDVANTIGRYTNGRVIFNAAESESGRPQETGSPTKSNTGRE